MRSAAATCRSVAAPAAHRCHGSQNASEPIRFAPDSAQRLAPDFKYAATWRRGDVVWLHTTRVALVRLPFALFGNFRTVDVLAQLDCGSSLFAKKRRSNICANLNAPEFSEENERFCMGRCFLSVADQSMRSLGYRVPLAHWDVAVGVIASLAARWSCATRQQSNDLRARIIRIRCRGSWRVLEHLSRPSRFTGWIRNTPLPRRESAPALSRWR